MARRRWSFTMSPLEHRFIRWLDDYFRGQLTPAGRVLLIGTAGATTLLLGGLVPALLVVLVFCGGALIAAVLVGAPYRPRLELQRRLPAFPSAGDVLQYSVVVTNTGTAPARAIQVEERGLPAEVRPVGEAPQLDELQPGQSAEVRLALRCQARGAYELPGLQAATAFPTGLVKWSRRQPGAERLLVYPRFTPLEGFDVPAGRNYQPGGIAIASEVGDSTEFLGTRDFRDGDPIRQIHWPSSARAGKLIAKEFEEEYFVRLALVLDVEVTSRAGEERFERSLSLAAGIADVLARQEYIVDLFAAGPNTYHFQAGRALAHFENILEILACLEPGDRLNMEALEALLLPEAERLSAVILLVMGWDEARAALVRKLKAHGVAVRVLSLDPASRPEGLAPGEEVRLP